MMVAEDAGLEDGKVAWPIAGCAHWSHDLAGKFR